MAKLVAENLNESIQSIGKTQQVLDFIREAGPEGKRYSDIIRFAYNLSYGEGSYDADTEPTKTTHYGNHTDGRTGGNPHRGYWSGAFKTPSRDDRGWGHLMKYIVKADNGNWVLRDEKMSPEEAAEGGNSFVWPNKTKYKEDAYPSRPDWKKDYDENGNYNPKFQHREKLDAKEYAKRKASGEDMSGFFAWSDDED